MSYVQKELQASKKELVKLTKDKEKLSHQVIQLEHFKDEYEDNKKQLTSCKQETEKSVKQMGEQKETEVNSLKEKLQDKDSEISAIKAQLAQARNIENLRHSKPEAEGLEDRDEKEEAPRKEANNESAEKSMFGEKHSEWVTSQKPEKQKQTSDSILDDRYFSCSFRSLHKSTPFVYLMNLCSRVLPQRQAPQQVLVYINVILGDFHEG